MWVSAPCLFLSWRQKWALGPRSWVSAQGWVAADTQAFQGLVIASESGGSSLPKSHPHGMSVADRSVGCFKPPLWLLPLPKPAIVLSARLSSSFSFASCLLCPAATSPRRVAVPISVNASSLLSHKSRRLPVNPGKRCRDSAPADSRSPACKSRAGRLHRPGAMGRARGKRDDVTHPAAASRRQHGPPDLPRSGAAPCPRPHVSPC